MSAKFHVVGDESEWLRIRLQEEVHAHGLEGSILKAGDKTLVVVVDGEKSVVKRLYSDVGEFLPEGIGCTELKFSLHRPPRGVRIRRPGETFDAAASDYILQYVKEIEKTTQRLDQKLNSVLAILEGVDGAEILRRSSTHEGETFEEKDMDVEEEAAGGFAAMFGD